MFATIIDKRVHLKLSRRNLRELQAILDNPEVRHKTLGRTGENGVFIVVEVEDDATHYTQRRRMGLRLRRVA
jgi:hypothetical protein